MIEYFLFLLGIFFLIKGACYIVEGSSSLANKLGVPALVIGLTIVAFGTSTPELVVNIFDAVRGSTDIAFGNIPLHDFSQGFRLHLYNTFSHRFPLGIGFSGDIDHEGTPFGINMGKFSGNRSFDFR